MVDVDNIAEQFCVGKCRRLKVYDLGLSTHGELIAVYTVLDIEMSYRGSQCRGCPGRYGPEGVDVLQDYQKLLER